MLWHTQSVDICCITRRNLTYGVGEFFEAIENVKYDKMIMSYFYIQASDAFAVCRWKTAPQNISAKAGL